VCATGGNTSDGRESVLGHRPHEESFCRISLERGVNEAGSGEAGGLWEPEFTVDNSGRLICFYSDETVPSRHSQRLYAKTSRDGRSWDGGFDVVALRPVPNRPGMANVRKINGGKFIMTYEVCGVGGILECAAHMRSSSDGANWGNPQDAGTLIRGVNGEFFAHAPVLAWKPPGSGDNGVLYLTGQMLFNSNGSPNSGSGATLFYSPGGTQAWESIGAPVPVPFPPNNYCPNYSPALVVYDSEPGYSIFEISTKYVGPTCMAFYATRKDN